jgi:hypothetical protein
MQLQKLFGTVVPVAATQAPPADARVEETASIFVAQYELGEAWQKDMVELFTAKELVTVLRSFVRLYNERHEGFDPFQGEDVVATCCGKTGIVYRRLFQWIFEVRLGLTQDIAKILECRYALTHVPKAPLTHQVQQINAINSAVAVMHMHSGNRAGLPFRGYRVTSPTAIGGEENNIWSKDAYMVPGITARTKNRSGKEEVQKKLFPKAYGKRLDLEDAGKFYPALSLVRALRAAAVERLLEQQIEYGAEKTEAMDKQIKQARNKYRAQTPTDPKLHVPAYNEVASTDVTIKNVTADFAPVLENCAYQLYKGKRLKAGDYDESSAQVCITLENNELVTLPAAQFVEKAKFGIIPQVVDVQTRVQRQHFQFMLQDISFELYGVKKNFNARG